MKFSLSREELLQPLQRVIGAVERRNTLAILGNVLITAENGMLYLTATDTEIELSDSVAANIEVDGEATLPARKLFDICKTLSDGAEVLVEVSDSKALVRSGRSRFNLATLPAAQFPKTESLQAAVTFSLGSDALAGALGKTAFSMAQQDVRYYLNGLLLEINADSLRAVTTDGHRLSFSEAETSSGVESRQAIIPRKGVSELIRLLDSGAPDVEVAMTDNHVQFQLGSLRFTSKLIDGRFPDYNRVIPSAEGFIAQVDKASFKQALSRVAILANEKYKGVRLEFTEGQVKVQTNNPEQEEAEEELAIDYTGPNIEIGFNVSYVIDVLGAIEGDDVSLKLTDGNSSCLVTATGTDHHKYVVMPMRL